MVDFTETQNISAASLSVIHPTSHSRSKLIKPSRSYGRRHCIHKSVIDHYWILFRPKENDRIIPWDRQYTIPRLYHAIYRLIQQAIEGSDPFEQQRTEIIARDETTHARTHENRQPRFQFHDKLASALSTHSLFE